MRYRVRWTDKPTPPPSGYVLDGGQDGDAWEGSLEEALDLCAEMREREPHRVFVTALIPEKESR